MRITLREHDMLPVDDVPAGELRLLRQLDEQQRGAKDETAIDWRDARYLRAKNYVGVLEVPGLSIEILPKVAGVADGRSRSNLVTMLCACGRLPVRAKALAGLALEDLPLMEVLMSAFSTRLLDELRRGAFRTYVRHEESLVHLRGKLLVSDNVRRNLLTPHRLHVAFDEFTGDNALNRILKRTCALLVRQTRIGVTQSRLQRALVELQDARDAPMRARDVDAVHLNRHSQRFAELLAFCRMVLAGESVTFSGGESRCFSMMFPMERVFEEFVAVTMRDYAAQMGLCRDDVHTQGGAQTRYLLRTPGGGGVALLKPDIAIATGVAPPVVIDTKWKVLRGAPSQSDVYQMYAYAHRYGCREVVLLYPKTAGAEAREYAMLDASGPAGMRLRVEVIDLGRDLRTETAALVRELRGVVGQVVVVAA